jgi:hypothetical protein
MYGPIVKVGLTSADRPKVLLFGHDPHRRAGFRMISSVQAGSA